jgi:effector-binding domain-containing protein
MPTIQHREPQPYVAVRQVVPMTGLAGFADRLREVFGWLAGEGVAPAGPPFLKYNVIDMDRGMEMEGGVPLAAPIDGEGDIVAGTLPGGRYVVVRHTGHPDELMAVTKDLLEWADEQGLTWDKSDGPDGEQWVARLEFYQTDPAVEPTMAKWITELAFRLAD